MIPVLPNPKIIDELYEWARTQKISLQAIPEEQQSTEATPSSDDEPREGKNMINF